MLSIVASRSANNARFAKSLVAVKPARMPNQARSMGVFDSISNAGKQRKLEQLKKQMEKSPSESTTLAYLNEMANFSAKTAAQQIEKGWTDGKLPASEPFLKIYLKSVSAMGMIDKINFSQLIALLNQHNGVVGGQANNSNIDLARLIMATKSTGGAISTHFSGGSAAEPLFVKKVEQTWKAFAQRTLTQVIGAVIVLSFIGSFFEEKAGSGTSTAGGGLASRLGMGGSIVKLAEKPDKTFDDVVGVDEAKADLQEIVMYLKDPKKFTRLGGRLPKGVLLTGPPGTGKTLLARAIAGEAGVPFFHTSGSEFEEMYVGVGAKRVRELFEAAKAKSPCIIFIDEIDAIGGSRQLKDQSAMKMTLNQLLVEMDGFAQNTGIIVIAATNFPDSLDTALVRPGRLDKHVDVSLPDIGGRQAILELYGKKIPLDPDVSMEQLARGTPGFSGAELFNLINHAALKASVDGLRSVGMGALEYAKDKIMMGSERKSAVISPETMRMTAFHEAGHALVALKTEGSDPIHKATIMPRGRALGMVMQLPDGDQTSMSRKQMLARLDICMGGRVAEELIYGPQNVTSGASSDIQQATNLAKAMVTKYGFSEKVGIVFIDEKTKQSGETQAFIDNEVRELLTASYNRAKHILETHRKELENIALGLIEYESLSGHEIVEVSVGKVPNMAKRSQKPSRATQVLPVSKTASQPSTVPGAKTAEKKAPTTAAPVPSGGNAKPTPVSAVPATPVVAVPVVPLKGSFFSFGKKPEVASETASSTQPANKSTTSVAPSAVAKTPATPADKKTVAPSSTTQQESAKPATTPATPVVATTEAATGSKAAPKAPQQ